jgi:PHD/YefM family antitoxin component YafN of YafNO toxin-antitoxin module
MKQVSTAELVRHIGDVTRAAIQAPVIITQHKKPRFVLMDIEQFEFMRSKDPRRSYRMDEMPEELATELTEELERLLAEKSGDDANAAA